MKWIRAMKYQSNRELICRTDDIDYIVMRECDQTADVYLKNGHQFTVESSGLWDHLVPMNEKTVLNSLYGMSVARPLPDYDPEILRKEIEDLKLENDRLKQREVIMLDFIKSIDCTDRNCIRCMVMGENGTCKWTLFPYRVEMVNDVLKKLEEL